MLSHRTSVLAGKRYKVASASGAAVTDRFPSTSGTIHRLPRDTVVVSAEVLVEGNGEERVRINSPAGWVGADHLEPAEPAASLRLDFETFKERHIKVAAGDCYGLEFPFTFELLREFGAEFLTAAFRAAGAISQDNRVTEIVDLKPLAIPGASENAFLTVAYAHSEPGLHTELFVKFPPRHVEHKFALSAMSHGEIEMMRLSRQGSFPVDVAKYYYGDFCSHTSNCALITERIKFGVPPIEPAHRKGYDHEVSDIEDHYRVLTKALARLVAAHKTGAMGYDLERIFPFARAARDFHPIAGMEVKIDRLIDFIGRIAPQLFVAEGSNPAFLEKWREDLLFGLTHKDAVIGYLHENVDYTGLCHPNLNVDNAWYWRDESGELRAGLLDWGGAGQMSIAQALSGMLMMPQPEMHLQLVREVIAMFVREYAEQGGVALDPDELTFHYKASLFSTAIGTIVDIVVDPLFSFSEEDYAGMKDRFDRRLLESGLYAAIIWIDNMLREWLEEVTPGDACRRIVAQRS
jgi:hypothetical protein